MQFELSEEQVELASFLRDLLEGKSDSTSIRTTIKSDEPYDQELWGILCEQIGAASLAIPEQYGGAGFTTRETHIVLEELGRALTPSPFYGSVAIAAQAILESKNEDACERLLPEIASGEKIATLAWATPQGKWNPAAVGVTAAEGANGWVVSGSTPYVLDGAYADTILVLALTPAGPALFEVTDNAAVARETTKTLDQTLNLATLAFNDASANLLTADASHLQAVLDHALTATSALQVGAASRGLDMTVEYSKQRSQFGRLIGSFQALKHRMADMLVALERARTTSYAAAWAEAQGEAGAGLTELAKLAKATCTDSLNLIATDTIQLHGGIAITWEHDAHLVFKRAHATAQLFGNASEQRHEIAKLIGLNA